MLKVVLLAVLATTLAQAFPSCGGEKVEVVGWVERKGVDQFGHTFYLTINSVDYDVPGYFWSQVKIGDLVKWDGTDWTIVKKGSEPPGEDLAHFSARFHVGLGTRRSFQG